VPFDPHLRPGGVIDVVEQMTPSTRRKFLQITAIVAHHFAARSRGGGGAAGGDGAAGT
jgi:hypothetical protein